MSVFVSLHDPDPRTVRVCDHEADNRGWVQFSSDTGSEICFHATYDEIREIATRMIDGLQALAEARRLSEQANENASSGQLGLAPELLAETMERR